MKKDWDLSQEAFDQLLSWLNPDREDAGRKYEEIRLRLIKIFTCRGCVTPEDLADDTINRVAKKVPEIAPSYAGDPALYFLGVAHNVCLEHFRKKPEPEPPPQPDEPERKEQMDECLEHCMQRLTSKNRQLILEYYREEKHSKIDHRKELAQQLGHRLECVKDTGLPDTRESPGVRF